MIDDKFIESRRIDPDVVGKAFDVRGHFTLDLGVATFLVLVAILVVVIAIWQGWS